MSTANAVQRPRPVTTTQNGDGKTLLDRVIDNTPTVTYKPFLAADAITLSAKMVLDYLCTPTKKGYLCDMRMATRFVMMCKARGLDPWQGDAYIIGYDSEKDGPQFSIVTAHQAYLKRAEVHPEYDGMESGVIAKRGEVTVEYQGDMLEPGDILIGGWSKVFFKKRTHPIYRRSHLARCNKGFGLWGKQPEMMIVKTAESDALRSAFPNQLGGMYLDDMPVMTANGGFEDEAYIPPSLEEAGLTATPHVNREVLDSQLKAVIDAARAAKLLPKAKWIAILQQFGLAEKDHMSDQQVTQVGEAIQELLDEANRVAEPPAKQVEMTATEFFMGPDSDAATGVPEAMRQ